MFETTNTATAINPLAVLKPTKPPRLYTLEEYLRFDARSPDKHEYYNGKIVKMAFAKGTRNIIASNLIAELKLAIRKLGANFIVMNSDQKIYLPTLNFSLGADALAVCEEPAYWDDNEMLLINPFLVIEVLSKSTQKYDRTSKFDEYKTLPSFREYVLVRKDTQSVETRFLEEPGLWRETVTDDPDGSVFLKSIGGSLSMKDLYARQILRETAAVTVER